MNAHPTARCRVRRAVATLLMLGSILLCAVPSALAASYVVSVLPLQGLVQELAGDAATVEVLVGRGESPALFEPTARQLTRLSHADALFVVGVPFESALVPRLARQWPTLRIVDAAAGIERVALPEAAAGQAHGDHAHGELDPHVWMAPETLRQIVLNLADALATIEPQEADAIAARAALIDDRLARLDEELRASLAPLEGRSFLTHHPAFGYFARSYHLVQLAVESGGTEPSARHLARMAAKLAGEDLRILIVQPQFSAQRGRVLARTLGVELVEVDPLRPDVEEGLRAFARLLVDRLKPAASPGGTR